MPTKKNPALAAARSRTKATPVPQLSQSAAPPTVAPAPPPSRTPAEQAMVDAWQKRGKAIPEMALRETDSGKEFRPSTGDNLLWAARMAELLKTDSLALLTHLSSQV